MIRLLAALFLVGPPRQAPTVLYLNPSWAPNGRTIVFESNRDGDNFAVYSIGADGSGLKRLTPKGVTAEQPAFRADGKQIVFRSNRDGEAGLYLMDPDGSRAVPIPNTTLGFFSSFSSDGRWILFGAQDAPGSPIYRAFVIRPDGSGRRELGDSTKNNEGPRWTRDGKRVVLTEVPRIERRPNEAMRDFGRRRDQGQQLVTVAPDGSDRRPLPPGEADTAGSDPTLSRDGRRRVVTKEGPGGPGLYIRDLATGRERLLIPTPPA